MKIHHYDDNTGVYLTASVAPVCPVSGINILPAFSTEIDPPKLNKNQVAIFKNNNWIKKTIK